jgi:hypothetical protein
MLSLALTCFIGFPADFSPYHPVTPQIDTAKDARLPFDDVRAIDAGLACIVRGAGLASFLR